MYLQRWLVTTACVVLAAVAAGGQTVVHVTPAPQPAGPLWMGLGVEFDPYSMPPPPQRWAVIEQRLDAMRPGFFRVMLDGADFCAGFDADGKPRYAWQPGEAANTALQARWAELRRVLGYAQSRGVRVLLGQWSPPGNLGIRTPADPRWAAMQADLAAYLITQDHDSVIRNVIPFNEPNGQWMWHRGAPDYAAWIADIRNLRQALDARGLAQVGIAGPDNSGDTPWFNRTVQQDHTLFAAWESHIYADDDEVLGGRILSGLQAQSATIAHDDPQGASKERFIAESGLQTGKIDALDQQPRVHDFDYGVLMADYVTQVAGAGWLGADAWDLDDAMHTNGHGGLKIWGFWDSSTGAGMQTRPWYSAWTLLSHALPRGAALEQTTGFSGSLRAAAASRGDGGESVVLVNEAATPATVRVEDTRLRGPVTATLYTGTGGSLTQAAPQTVTNGTMSVTIPAHSVAVLMTSDAPAQR